MAWKREWHVEVTCEKCGTKKEVNVTCRQDEVGHATWRLSFCDNCKEWMKAQEIVTPILKRRPTKRAPDAGDSAASRIESPLSGEVVAEQLPAATQRR